MGHLKYIVTKFAVHRLLTTKIVIKYQDYGAQELNETVISGGLICIVFSKYMKQTMTELHNLLRTARIIDTTSSEVVWHLPVRIGTFKQQRFDDRHHKSLKSRLLFDISAWSIEQH